MSMLSAQVDELRETADELQDHATFTGYGGTQNTDPMALEAATLMRDAADTIWNLRDTAQQAGAENAKLRKELGMLQEGYGSMSREHSQTIVELSDALTENDRLRELVRDMWSVMWACSEQRCRHRDKNCYRVRGNGGDICASESCWYENRMRELGVEVE